MSRNREAAIMRIREAAMGSRRPEAAGSFRYFNLNKWYWKLLLLVIVVFFMVTVITVIGGIFALLMRFEARLF